MQCIRRHSSEFCLCLDCFCGLGPDSARLHQQAACQQHHQQVRLPRQASKTESGPPVAEVQLHALQALARAQALTPDVEVPQMTGTTFWDSACQDGDEGESEVRHHLMLWWCHPACLHCLRGGL